MCWSSEMLCVQKYKIKINFNIIPVGLIKLLVSVIFFTGRKPNNYICVDVLPNFYYLLLTPLFAICSIWLLTC